MVENALIQRAREVLATYEAAAPMIMAGLYAAGTDAEIDRAIAIWPKLDAFFGSSDAATAADAFNTLQKCLEQGADAPPR